MIIYTIGHSTRPLDDFAGMLLERGVDYLVDVRAYPGSRTNPQYNKESLSRSLPERGIGYQHIRELGGRRKPKHDTLPSPNTFWKNQSFRNYADYAMTQDFQDGLKELIETARKHTCAIMCSEAVWWRCHRRIISDYIIKDGITVCHIMSMGKATEARLTEGATITAENKLIYT